MIYRIIIFIASLFLITIIAYIAYLVFHYFLVAPNAANGIDDATLRTWPTLTYAEAKSQDLRAVNTNCCPVCLADYEEERDKALRLFPECGHLFHAACVDPWLRRRRTCPLCRSLLLKRSIQTHSTEEISIEIDQD